MYFLAHETRVSKVSYVRIMIKESLQFGKAWKIFVKIRKFSNFREFENILNFVKHKN